MALSSCGARHIAADIARARGSLVARILAKLGVHSRAQAVAIAVRENLPDDLERPGSGKAFAASPEPQTP